MIQERSAAGYDFQAVERKWQDRWEAEGLYRVRNDGRPPYYVLEMLPYPSGDLHVGHAKNYTLGDAVARFMRMRGYDVLHPMGWDAFGLPAENAAIQRGVAPRAWTEDNIRNMQRQIRLMGTGYDWTREFATCDPTYYRWNQWIFLKMYERGLAYKREAPVNWCPVDQTVLANEQAEGGVCWRCGSPVERRNLSQWFLKITAYADRLLESLDRLPGWPDRIKAMQRNWIGRSEGCTFSMAVDGIDARIACYTTRVDTLFGVTFLAVAAEHPVVAQLTALAPEQREAVTQFIESVKNKSELERTSLMEKAGVPTGAFAIHPLTGARIPIWVTNYVLAEYGTGAVMGVPAHDQRDYEFATKFGLPIAQVVRPADDAPLPEGEAYEDDGILINSDGFDGMASAPARRAIAAKLGELGIGEWTVNYRFRDWLISRQRYWGTPIPIIYCPTHGEVPVPEAQLPVILPSDVPITGEGSPLARDESFVNTTCPICHEPARRETDTMDTFFESSWYYVRYLDSHDEHAPFDQAVVNPWLPVDQYIGGAEHAVLHLLYARFFYKVFCDLGLLDPRGNAADAVGDEPFARLFNQGMVLYNGEKMSKSRGNVVGIDDTANRHGVDAMRLFLLAATPPEDTMDWTEAGISGRVRFVNRVWRACEPFAARAGALADFDPANATTEAERGLLRALHNALKAGIDETESRRFHYNTVIARLDELVNALTAAQRDPAMVEGAPGFATYLHVVSQIPLVIAPFAPHLAEELWSLMGRTTSVHLEHWPEVRPEFLALDTIEMVIQVNGKIRGRVTVAPGASQDEVVALANAQAPVQAQLEGKTIRKQIFVPDKLLNIVVS